MSYVSLPLHGSLRDMKHGGSVQDHVRCFCMSHVYLPLHGSLRDMRQMGGCSMW